MAVLDDGGPTGFLVPRMLESERDSMRAFQGLMVWNRDALALQVWQNGFWYNLAATIPGDLTDPLLPLIGGLVLPTVLPATVDDVDTRGQAVGSLVFQATASVAFPTANTILMCVNTTLAPGAGGYVAIAVVP